MGIVGKGPTSQRTGAHVLHVIRQTVTVISILIRRVGGAAVPEPSRAWRQVTKIQSFNIKRVPNTGHPLLRSVHIVNRLFPQRGLGIVFFHFVISYLLTNDSLYPETDL